MSYEQLASNTLPISPRVIIIGAGIGGLTSGIALKRQLAFHNFAIYERSDDIGGTWHLNTYPGCASDVATHWYSLSSDLRPDWNQTHVFQPELKSYWKDLAEKYQLYDHVSLFTEVLGAEWDASYQMYRVDVRDVRSGVSRQEYATAIISAHGVLDVPHHPKELRGIQDAFKGAHFHSARWNHSVDLRNKRVAVIGNGCSAAQFVPVISADPTTQVVSFIRTPAWFLPKERYQYTEFHKNIFTYVPFAMRVYRFLIALKQELSFVLYLQGGPSTKRREELTKALTEYIAKSAPAEYVQQLIPDYPAGCKRLIIDTGYFEALHRPNNNLNFDGIAEVTEKGILTKKGELLEFDVIIEATGFVADEYPVKIRGVDSVSIQDYHREQGGPTAYRGTTVPGFPNFFVLSGPNMGTGHGSVVYTEEVQVHYIMQMLKPVFEGRVSSFEITHEATDAYNRGLQKKLSTSIWSYCHSWYRAGNSGKNTVIWPGTLAGQWWMLLWPEWKHYKAVNGRKWAVRRFVARLGTMAVFAGLVFACIGFYYYPARWFQWCMEVREQVQQLLSRFEYIESI